MPKPPTKKRSSRKKKKIVKAPFIRPSEEELNNKIWAGIACFIIGYIWFCFKSIDFIEWLLVLFGFFNPLMLFVKICFAQPFTIPYLFTMIKTKSSLIFLLHCNKFAKALEVISLIGSILGFGLVAVDY